MSETPKRRLDTSSDSLRKRRSLLRQGMGGSQLDCRTERMPQCQPPPALNHSSIFQPATSTLNQPSPVINQSAVFQPATWIPNQLQSMINLSAIFQLAPEAPYQPPPAINQSAIFQPATQVANHPQAAINHCQSAIFQPATQIPNQPVIDQSAIFQPAARAPNQTPVINPSTIVQPATQIPNQPVIDQSAIFQPAAQAPNQTPVINPSTIVQPATPIPNQPPLLLVDQQSSSDKLLLDAAICKGHTLYPELSFTKTICDKGESIEVTQRFLYHLSGATYLSVARVLFIPSELPTFTYEVQVLFTTIFSGIVQTFNEFFAVCNIISKSSPYKFCPGFNEQSYLDQYYAVIRYHVKGVRIWRKPFTRIDSENCLMWHQLANNVSVEEKMMSTVLCRQCKRLHHDLEHQKRRSQVSPERRLARQQPSSSFKLKYLSPASIAKRKKVTQMERSADKAKLAKYDDLEVTLDDEQSDELSSILSKIEENSADELDKIFKEADGCSVGDSVRAVWELDLNNSKETFFKDQQSNSNGCRKNRWSLVTIRIALAVFIRSPSAYEALKSFNILQLPSRATLQAYTGAFMHEAGAASECINKQVEKYKIFQQSCEAEKRPMPKSNGVLIFDEVKVISSLMWNSRSHQIVGLAMTEEMQASLHDVFQLFDKDHRTKQTSYILQFLWRDLTSSFDIVGPYYTSEETMTAKVICSCVFETIKLFQVHNLRTSLLVCDGAAPNLAALKATHGCCGMYGTTSYDGSDPYAVKPWFFNPFNPPHHIHWLICPSHQLKNMINALFSSQAGGTKTFTAADDTTFGWKAILDLYSRECQRRDKGHARMVPKLREVHVLRDAWTKLNVLPAKIMQQELVLSELHQYTTQVPEPEDTNSVKLTLQYLEACNRIFEKGFLSHEKICDIDSPVMLSISTGFSYFQKWHKALSDKGTLEVQDPRFLSWQTFDLLRVCVYSFSSFVKAFLEEFPEHFISPLRLSGSAVETLFSQFKHTAGGKLSATNYSTARAAHLIKHTVAYHHSSVSYRDVPLHLTECTLQKKKYGCKQ